MQLTELFAYVLFVAVVFGTLFLLARRVASGTLPVSIHDERRQRFHREVGREDD